MLHQTNCFGIILSHTDAWWIKSEGTYYTHKSYGTIQKQNNTLIIRCEEKEALKSFEQI